MTRTTFAVLLVLLTLLAPLAACHHERPGSHARCGGMTYPPVACPAGETCVDVPTDACDPAHGGRDCPTYCVTGEP